MAGYSTWCKETDEKINYTKLCRLMVDGGTQAVRSVFDGIHPPSSLTAILNTNKTTLQKLKKPKGKVLNNEQWDKLYPPSGSKPKSEDFDITLLFVLLRNICGLTPPATGWDVLPPITDKSLEANLARIKYYRNNTIAHRSKTEINDVDFEQYWQDISSALLSLGLSQEDIDELKLACLGEKDYNQLLYDWYISDENIKTQLEDLKSDTTDIKEKVHDLHFKYVQAYRQYNSIDQLSKDEFSGLIDSLCKSFHPNTRQWILDQVKSHVENHQPESCIMLITAGPGMGKSTVAAKICEMYKDLGCLGGCHFFQFSNSTRNNPRLMLQSIARQMCDNVPGYEMALEKKLQTDLGKKIPEMKCEELFTVLFEEPLHKLKTASSTINRFVIVLDATDECSCHLKSELKDVIEFNLPMLPSWIRFVITTRPPMKSYEPNLKSKINFHIHENDPRNKNDLKIFFTDNLKLLYNNPSDQSQLVEQLVKVSKGLFLVAFFVMDYQKKEKPDSPSEVVGLFPNGISSVYEKYFSRLKNVLLPYISQEKSFFEMLKAIVAARHPIEKNFFYTILRLKSQREVREDPGLEIKSRKASIDLLHSLFPVENDHVTVFHKSVVDWLILKEDEEHDFSVCAEEWEDIFDSYSYLNSPKLEALQSIKVNTDEHLDDKKHPIEPHEFSVCVEDGNEVLFNRCYDILSDIRNGKKDLDKPLDLTDSEKYALQIVSDAVYASSEKMAKLQANCYVICAGSIHFTDFFAFPFPFIGNHFLSDLSDVCSAMKGFFYVRDHDELCPFRRHLNFFHGVAVFFQAAKVLEVNEDKISPKPTEFLEEHHLPFSVGKNIVDLPKEYSFPKTSILGLLPKEHKEGFTSFTILACENGMILCQYTKRQTAVQKYALDGTLLAEKAFPGLKRLCISPDQRFIVASKMDEKGDIEIIDAKTLEVVTSYQSPNVIRSCHVFGDEPWYIVARCYNNKIYVMEGETGKLYCTIDVDQNDDVEAVSTSGLIILSRTWVGMEFQDNLLFTDDDGNFIEEMNWSRSDLHGNRGTSFYRKLFLLSALEGHMKVSIYPQRKRICSCWLDQRYHGRETRYLYQAMGFSKDGVFFGYQYKDSIFIVKSQDGSLFKRLYLGYGFSTVSNILFLSETDIVVIGEQSSFILVIDVPTNHIKHLLFLPGGDYKEKIFVVPRKQGEPLAIIVKFKESIFQYVFHNLD